MPANNRKNTKTSGSFRIETDVKNGIDRLAKKENRSFNNMLEVICRRAVEQNEKGAI